MITERQIMLVQDSYSGVVLIADEIATLFYQRLFTLNPALESLFKNDMSDQRRKLMRTLQVSVRGLNNVEALEPILQQLAVRHVGYRVELGMYATVGTALLWALEEGLGESFTDEVRAAWTAVYELFAGMMLRAAHEAAAAAS